jgi:DNA polymerase-4
METGLTASAGVSVNKFLAKVASDMHKPDGLTVVRPHEVDDFIRSLPIERFFGVGPATARRLKKLGIHNGGDMRAWSEIELVEHFGKTGRWFYKIARGIDNRSVAAHRTRKSIGAERTFFDNLTRQEDILKRLRSIAEHVAERMKKSNAAARTVTVKIRDADFVTVTRSHTMQAATSSAEDVYSVACRLFLDRPPDKPIRLLGISLSGLQFENSPGLQLGLDLQERDEF